MLVVIQSQCAVWEWGVRFSFFGVIGRWQSCVGHMVVEGILWHAPPSPAHLLLCQQGRPLHAGDVALLLSQSKPVSSPCDKQGVVHWPRKVVRGRVYAVAVVCRVEVNLSPPSEQEQEGVLWMASHPPDFATTRFFSMY